MSNDGFDPAFDEEESAFHELGEFAGNEVRNLKNRAKDKVLDKLGIRKLKKWLAYAVSTMLVFLLVFLLLYGAADYIHEYLDGAIYDLTHLSMGELGDDYQRKYYNEAKILLDALQDGTIDIGNDMSMLSESDLEMILQYVVDYNDKFFYETNPEKIKYWYLEREKTTDLLSNPVWRNRLFSKKYSFEALSYQTLADGFYNSYTDDNGFSLSWQTVVALCEMIAENNYKNFGSNEDGWNSRNYSNFQKDYSFQTSMDGYFVTDSQVNAICGLLAYDIVCYKVEGNKDYIELTRELVENGEGHEEYGLEYSADEMLRNTYKLYTDSRGIRLDSSDFVLNKDTGIVVKTSDFGKPESDSEVLYEDLRIPALAPYSISNCYTLVTYEYQDAEGTEEGAKCCVAQTVTTDAKRFVNYVSEMIPNFSFNHFLELLRLLPGTQKEVDKFTKLKELYERGNEKQKLYDEGVAAGIGTNITADDVEKAYQHEYRNEWGGFGGYKTYIGTASRVRSNAGQDFTGAGAVWIGSHMNADGTIYTNSFNKQAVYNDWFPVEDGAMAPMDSSEGLTLDQIKEVLQYMSGKMYANALDMQYMKSDRLAELLYEYQESEDACITTTFAIMRIEGIGNLQNLAAVNKWNFINYGSVDYKEKYTGLYESMEDAFAHAVLEQVQTVNVNYLKNGQATYFEMQFGAGFTSNLPDQQQYEESESQYLKHCFCPWYEDVAFPFGNSGFRSTFARGWCNRCAEFREEILNHIGITLKSSFYWPLESYLIVTSGFGYRDIDVEGASSYHNGVDIAAAEGTVIYAIADGIVKEVSYNDSAGNFVQIEHSDGVYSSKYCHMRELSTLVRAGETVERGQAIGYVGHTGVTSRDIEKGGTHTGDHLHLSIKENGAYVDPEKYLAEPNDRVRSLLWYRTGGF